MAGSDEDTIIIKVGSVCVSKYVFERQLDLLEARICDCSPSERDDFRSDWIEGFLVDQVIIARALEDGLERCAYVESELDRMERHMLTSPLGPLYELLALERRSLQGSHNRDLGMDSVSQDGFPDVVLNERDVVLSERRKWVLNEVQFVVDLDVAKRVLNLIHSHPTNEVKIACLNFDGMDDLLLAKCFIKGEYIRYNVWDWIAYFNNSYIRSYPVSVAEMVASIETFVVQEYDLDEARRRRLDKSLRFLQNKDFFRNQLVLDVFEREILVPEITIGADDIEDYYESHSADFEMVTSVVVELREFRDSDSALWWLQLHSSEAGRVDSDSDNRGSQVEYAVVSIDKPIPGLESYSELILKVADGACIGPLQKGDCYAIVKKQATNRARMSLSDAEPVIRNALIRGSLSGIKRDHALQWSDRFEITDNLLVGEYAGSRTIRRPW